MLTIVPNQSPQQLSLIPAARLLEHAPIDTQRIMRNYAEGLCRDFEIEPCGKALITKFSDVTQQSNVTAISEWTYQQAWSFLGHEPNQSYPEIRKNDEAFQQVLIQQMQRLLQYPLN